MYLIFRTYLYGAYQLPYLLVPFVLAVMHVIGTLASTTSALPRAWDGLELQCFLELQFLPTYFVLTILFLCLSSDRKHGDDTATCTIVLSEPSSHRPHVAVNH